MRGKNTTHPLEDRRRRRIARRRREILTAAARVFAEKGYVGTTTKELAEAADVAEGTLYNYFGGKREILLAIADETEAPMETLLLTAGNLKDRADIITLMEQALKITETRLPFTRTLLAEAWVDDGILQDFVITRLRRIAQPLNTFIASRVATGQFRPIDPEVGTRLVMGMFAGLLLPVLRGVAPPHSQDERRELAETVVSLLLDGIRATDL